MIGSSVTTQDAPTLASALTEAFYHWDVRGRGWAVWPCQIDIEPPFEPFRLPVAAIPSGLDDGRVPSLFARLAAYFRTNFSQGSMQQRPRAPERMEPAPFEAQPASQLVHLQVSASPQSKIGKEISQQLLLGLGHLARECSFEFVGDGHKVRTFLTVAAQDAIHIEQTIRAYMPDASITSTSDGIAAAWNAEQGYAAVLEFGLSNEFLLPLSTPRSFEPEPLSATLAALGGLEPGECGNLQVLFKPVRNAWASEMLRTALGPSGDGLFSDAPTFVSLCKQKVSHPLFAVVIRIAASALTAARAWDIARRISSSFQSFALPTGNEFIPLSNEGYPLDSHQQDLLERTSRRSGMILNCEELACLAHIPDGSFALDALERNNHRTRKASEHLQAQRGTLLGCNVHHRSTSVYLTVEDRLRHMSIMGATGTGKTTLLTNIILQDLEVGHGVAVLDPHGDLVEDILGRMPASRISDTVVLDPSDARSTVPFNVLAACSEIERTVLASDLVSVFRRFSSSWGDVMTAVLSSAVAAFLDSPSPGTLRDLRRFLIDGSYREHLLASIQDEEIQFFWRNTFKHIGIKAIGPLLARLDAFLRPRPVREIVASEGPSLDVRALLDGGVLLVRLAQGAIGEDNGYLLGSLLVAKLHQAVFARQQLDASRRRPFFLHLDEAHEFPTASIATLLSGGRKSGLGLTLVQQGTTQFRGAPDVDSAITANVFTRICFRLGDTDARKLAGEFRGFDATDLTRLQVGKALARVGGSDNAFNLEVRLPPVVDEAARSQSRGQILTSSSARFGLPKQMARKLDDVAEDARYFDRTDRTRGSMVAASVVDPLAASTRLPTNPEYIRPALVPGRGGHEHKYLQQLVKALAQERGFRVVVEEAIPNGRVDVALYRGDLRIACEISISSSTDEELQHIENNLAAGYQEIILLSNQSHRIQNIKRAAQERLSAAEFTKLIFVEPAEIVSVLDRSVPSETDEQLVRGFKVKVTRRVVGPDDALARRAAVAKVIAKSLRNAPS